jgi:hypothetical protein
MGELGLGLRPIVSVSIPADFCLPTATQGGAGLMNMHLPFETARSWHIWRMPGRSYQSLRQTRVAMRHDRRWTIRAFMPGPAPAEG